MKTAFAIIVIALCSGCSVLNGSKVGDNTASTLQAYYKQDLNENLFSASGVSEFTMKGYNMDLKLNTFRQPISAIPKHPSTADTLLREGFSAARFIGGMYLGSKVLSDAVDTPRTVDPVVVRPEVIETQSAGRFSPGANN